MNQIDGTNVHTALIGAATQHAKDTIVEAVKSALQTTKEANDRQLEYLDSLAIGTVTGVTDNTDGKKMNYPAVAAFLAAGGTDPDMANMVKDLVIEYNRRDLNQGARVFFDTLGLLV